MLYSMWSLTVPVIIIHYQWKFPILIINKLTRPDWSGRKEVMMIWLSSLLSNCQISWQSNVLLFDFEIQKYDPVTLPFFFFIEIIKIRVVIFVLIKYCRLVIWFLIYLPDISSRTIKFPTKRPISFMENIAEDYRLDQKEFDLFWPWILCERTKQIVIR